MPATMRPPGRPPAVGLVHRKSLVGFRAACEAMWGTRGLEQIARRLAVDVRERTAGLLPLPEWIPLDDLIAWHFAVWDGPAEHGERVFMSHVRLTVDQGFGRVKRFLLSMSTPRSLAPRVAALWSDEYSTGRLEVTKIEERSVALSLRDHAYVSIPLMQGVIAEVYRYVVSLTQVENVTEVHAVRDARLHVIIRWA